MKIKLYRSATVGIKLDNFKVLMDPWLVDGEYFGSWSHFPKFDLDKYLDEINSYDAIYISHIHPDHCSDKTLKKINKNIPIYIHKYHAPFLKFKLEKIGFKTIEIKNATRTRLAKDAYINIYAADNCDPDVCFKFFGCSDKSATSHSQQIDSIAIFDDGKNVLVNTNDSPYELAKNTINRIKKDYDNINILLHGYQNASAYPQCFDNFHTDQEKLNEGKKIAKLCLDRALGYITSLKPQLFLPFAGTYALSGKLSNIDCLRGIPTIDSAINYLSSKQKHSLPIMLSPEAEFDFINSTYSYEYKKFNLGKYKTYVRNTLSKKKFDYEYEDFPENEEIISLAKEAFKKFIEKKLLLSANFKTDIFIPLKGMSIMLNGNNSLHIVNPDKYRYSNEFLSFSVDPRLLKSLLKGPRFAHWNNAEIGSHINFLRNTDTFQRDAHLIMSYFHN